MREFPPLGWVPKMVPRLLHSKVAKRITGIACSIAIFVSLLMLENLHVFKSTST